MDPIQPAPPKNAIEAQSGTKSDQRLMEGHLSWTALKDKIMRAP